MKIVYQGDLHLTDKTPANRIDDYPEAGLSKLSQLIDFANDNGALLLLGGDIFDTFRVTPEITNKAAEIFKRYEGEFIFTVLGQHDVPYHQMELIKSPLYTASVSGKVVVIEKDHHADLPGINIYPHNWESWVEPENLPDHKFNVFLGHVSVFKGSVPFYWKGEGYTPETLKKKFPGFDLYLCGDIHSPLVEGNVVVSGPMMRDGIDLEDYKPRCYLIDTDTMSIEPLFYKIEKNVFNTQEERMASLDITSLVEALKGAGVKKREYRKDCISLTENRDEVKTYLEEEIFNEITS